MSNTQFAFIRKSRVPTGIQLQASIDALGFSLSLDPEFTPFDDEGFSPCVLEGEDGSGFEIFYEEAESIIDGDDDLEKIANGRDYCISMVWRSSMKDMACVMIVSCALARDFDAVISFEGEEPEDLTALIESAKKTVAEVIAGES